MTLQISLKDRSTFAIYLCWSYLIFVDFLVDAFASSSDEAKGFKMGEKGNHTEETKCSMGTITRDWSAIVITSIVSYTE